MTIAINLKVNDGLVLAADSATTLVEGGPQGQPVVSNVYNNANKIFNLRKGLPIGAITWGAGSIGHAAISTLMKDLRARFAGDDSDHKDWKLDPKSYTVEHAARQAREFLFDELYTPTFASLTTKPTLGLIVAGYSAKADMADEFMILIDNGKCDAPQRLRPPDACGVTWNGQPEAISRLVFGFGTQLPQVLQTNFGLKPADIPKAIQIIRSNTEVYLVKPAMPLQDAIDLAAFFVDLTIKFSRFMPGAPTVGGPIEVAAISKHEGFKWVTRKYYYDRAFNPEVV